MRRRLAIAMLLASGLARAQPVFPSKAVKLVVAFPAGGSTDLTARLIAAKLAERWHQPVVVENKPGAGANLGTAFVAKAPPDGHTLLLATTALTISPSVFKQPGYDATKDLAPVTLVSTIPNVLVVNPSLPVRTVGEFIAYAKDHPGQLNFAAPGASSGQRMTFELIKQITGADIVMVAYAGGAPALQAVLSGQVEAMIVNVVEAATHVKSGQLRALAVTTARRNAMLPDVPTLAETVAPQLDTFVWQGLLAPAGTPADVVHQVASDVHAVLELPDVRERLAHLGMDVVTSTPKAFGQFLRDDMATWRRVSANAGVKPE